MKRLSKEDAAKLEAMARSGKTATQVATALGMAVRTAGRRLRAIRGAQRATSPRRPAPMADAVTTSPADAPAPIDVADDPSDVPTRLRRVLATLERAAEQAEADKDVARIVQAQRALTQAAALLARLEPAPTVDVDERPDMLAAARRGRERLHALLDRLLAAEVPS